MLHLYTVKFLHKYYSFIAITIKFQLRQVSQYLLSENAISHIKSWVHRSWRNILRLSQWRFEQYTNTECSESRLGILRAEAEIHQFRKPTVSVPAIRQENLQITTATLGHYKSLWTLIRTTVFNHAFGTSAITLSPTSIDLRTRKLVARQPLGTLKKLNDRRGLECWNPKNTHVGHTRWLLHQRD